MATPPTGTPLGVDIEFPTFDRKTGVKTSDAFIIISFNEAGHAERYYDYLTKDNQSFHQKYNLRAARRGSRAIRMRLPSFFESASASVRCSGFLFSTDKKDRDFVEEWVSVLRILAFFPGSRTQVFVTRDWYNYPAVVGILLPRAPVRWGAESEANAGIEEIDPVDSPYGRRANVLR